MEERFKEDLLKFLNSRIEQIDKALYDWPIGSCKTDEIDDIIEWIEKYE